jgi:hypothetical protein
MRQFVAIVLIVCGTLLAMAPAASNFLQGQEIAEYLARQHTVGPLRFVPQPLEEAYRLGAWILGAGMIGLGIIGAWRYAAAGRAPSAINEERLLARAG